jgi:malate dehydrogenase (oxaloacetate-decarboxylating)(NADP+)
VAIEPLLDAHDMEPNAVTIIDPSESEKFEQYASRFHQLRLRSGVTLSDARTTLHDPNYFAMLMVDAGDADGVISGLQTYYPATVRPALQVLKTRSGVKKVSGVYVLVFKGRVMFLADTTVNINPTSEELAEIAELTAETARRFDIEPKIAMISFSNFGSTLHPEQRKVRDAVAIIKARHPELIVEGEMEADIAVSTDVAQVDYPWSAIQGDANVLIFPNLDAANAAYKLLWRLGNAEAIGPILQGTAKPVHVLQRGCDVSDIVNMAAIAVLDAQRNEAMESSVQKEFDKLSI